MNDPEEKKDGEPPEIRVVRRGNVVQSGGERSYGFILLLLAAIGIFVYMKWFNKSDDDKKSDGKPSIGEIGSDNPTPGAGKPASGLGKPKQYDIPIPSETERK